MKKYRKLIINNDNCSFLEACGIDKMRLKRRGSTPPAIHYIAEQAIPHLHKTAENIRERFNYNMRSFCLNAEITKAQIDRVYERLVEKVKAMSEKAKDDVDKLVKEEEIKMEANFAGKLLDIDNRYEYRNRFVCLIGDGCDEGEVERSETWFNPLPLSPSAICC